MANTTMKIPDDIKLVSKYRDQFPKIFDENSKVIKGKEKEAEVFEKEFSSETGISDYSPKQIGIALEDWYETLSQTANPEYSEVTMSGAPETFDSNTVSVSTGSLKQFIPEGEKRTAAQEQADLKAKSDVEASIKRQKEIYNDQIKRAEAAKKELEKQTKYAKIKETALDENQQKEIDGLKEAAQKVTTEKAANMVASEIKNRVGDTIPQEEVDLAAFDVAESLQKSYLPSIQTAVLQTAAKNKTKSEFDDLISGLSIEAEARLGLSKDVVTKAFGPGFKNTVFPDVIVSDSPQPGFTSISLDFISDKVVDSAQQKIWALENTGLEKTDYVNRLTETSFAGFEVQTVLPGTISLSHFKTAETTWQENAESTRFDIATGIKEPLGAAGFLAQQATNKVVAKAAGSVVAKVGAKTAISKLTATLGSLGGPVAKALSWVGGEVLSRINSKTVKKWSGLILGGLAFGISLPFLGLQAAAGTGLLTTIISAGFGGGVGGITIAGIGAGMGSFFSAFGGLVMESVLLPTLLILLVFPFVVALILFIINSGAYVVPLGQSLLNSTNPYIDVSKVADQPGPLSSPQAITYTVTVTAKKNVLTGITLKSTCKSIGKNGANINCANLEKIPGIADVPSQISPGAPYLFTFTSNYDSKYRDSLVNDQITVTALAGEAGKVTETGSASLCFGDCPLDCIKVVDNADKWPDNFKANLTAAAASLKSDYPAFVAKVCAGGDVNLCYNPESVPPIGTGGVCNGTIYARHDHSGKCDINFNQCGVKNDHDAEIMLAHEVTHHIQKIDGNSISVYEESGAPRELPLCSYSSTNGNNYEGMAESDALLIGEPSWVSCVSNYASLYPKSHAFAQKFMTGK